MILNMSAVLNILYITICYFMKILIPPTQQYLSVMQVIKMILNTFCTYKHPLKVKK